MNVAAKKPSAPFFFGSDAKVHLYPGAVEGRGEWHEVDRALMRDLSEDALSQNFSSEVAASLQPPEVTSDPPSQSLTETVVSEPVPQDEGGEEVTNQQGESDTATDAAVEATPTTREEETLPDTVPEESAESAAPAEESAPEPDSVPVNESAAGRVDREPVAKSTAAIVFGVSTTGRELFPLAINTSISTETTLLEDAVSEEPLVAEVTNDSLVPSEAVTDEVVDSMDSTEVDMLLEEEVASATTSASAPIERGSESHELIFSNFAGYDLRPGEHIQGVQLRLSLAALPAAAPVDGAPAPVLELYYRTPHAVTAIGTIVLDEEVSNAQNGGYLLFGMPTDMAVEALAEAEIVVRYYGEPQAVEELFIDSVWLEVDTKLVTKEDLENRMKAAAFKELLVPKISTFLSEQVNFNRLESPRFHLRYNSQRNAALRMVRELTGRDLVKVEEVTLLHHGLGRLPIQLETFTTADGITTVSVADGDRSKLRPGQYTIEMVMNEGGKTFTDSFDFQWGLLSWNPNKTEYHIGETANFSMGALTPNGNTICAADLQLFVTNPEGYVEYVPVASSGLCNGNNVTDTPDFMASYLVNTPGTYEIYLERYNEQGEVISFMTDTFTAVETQELSIERDGPTRIYPPSPYPMSLTVTSAVGFSGTLTERVPASFEVFDTAADIEPAGDFVILRWPLKLAAGESVTHQYSFNAPDISPYLFTLGPASIHVDESKAIIDAQPETDVVASSSLEKLEAVTATGTLELSLPEVRSDKLVKEKSKTVLQLNDFVEHREWQIASDAVGNMILFWDNNSSIPSGWSCLSCGSGTFYQRFAMGSSTYNTTGGATTHTHTATGTVLATAAAAATESSGSGVISINSHTHTYSPTIGTASNLPRYRQLRVIQYTTSAGEPATIPAGAIAIFDAAVPTGWTRYSAQDGYYIRGEDTASTTGGANTHTHTITGTTGGGTGGSYRDRGTAPQASGADDGHVHTISTSTESNNNEPPYITVILGQASSNTTPVNGMISMWTADVGTGWDDISSSASDPFSGRFLLGSSTYGVTGGAATSTHANVTAITSTAPTATNNANATAPLGGTSGSHTHSVNVTDFSVSNHLPPYLTVVFGKRLGTEPVFEQLSSKWYVNTNAQAPTDPWPAGATDLDEREAISSTNATVNPNGIVRLRMNVVVSNATSSAGSAFTLQYASTTATCAAATGWSAVGSTSASTIWRGYNNASVSDNSTLSSLVLASSSVAVTYNENGFSTSSPNAIGIGGIGEWDFVLQHNGAAAGTIYCFRLIEADGTPLGTYTHYPQLLTNAAPAAPTPLKYFDNEKPLTLLPTLEFVSTDPEDERIDYQVQISTDSAFGSTVVDKNTITDSSDFFNLSVDSDKPPFISGNTIQYVGTTNLASSTTYWWRVRGKDTDGSDTWGSWSTARSFTPDPSLTASAWMQTTRAQFDTDTMVGVEATAGNLVQLISGSTTGTLTSSAIDFTDGTSGTSWNELSFTDTETTGDIKYQIQYYTGTSWTLIPDTVLTGNSTGFDTSPVSLLDLDVDVYTQLRLVANFTNSGGTPTLQDWTVSWGYRVPTPTITAPFANEKVSTTTPTFIFVTDDAQDDGLTYQVQWSSSPLFTSSTTKTSDTHSGFINGENGGNLDPFNSGEAILFTIQSADALTASSTYWWRVRAKDTTGDNVYSSWTEARSFTVDASVTASTWYQTTREQFDNNTLSGTVGITGAVTVATTADEVLLVYGEGTTSTPKYRLWDGTTWSAEGDTLGIGAPLNWSFTLAAPTREEYLLVTIGTDASVQAQIFSTGSWGNQQTISTSTGNSAARGFGAAYETTSGDALVVSCNNGVNPVYYTWNGSSWTSGGTITMNYAGNCEWLQLVADPTSDEMVLLARNAAGSTYEAQVWNGSSWGNSTTLGSIANAASEGMAVVYEESGDQAIVITSDGNPSRFRWTAWNGSAWSAAATVATGGRVQWAEMVRNVGNDSVALCYVDHNSIIGAARWTGAAWTGQTTLDAAANTTASRAVSCAFETTSGRTNNIIAAYSDATNARYQIWNGATWSAEASISTVSDSPVVQLRRAGDGKVLGTFFDATSDRYDFSYWNGTTWATTTTLESDASVATAPYKEPFMMSPRNPGSEGTVIVSPPIVFSEGSGPYFESFSWNDTTPGTSDIVYQLQYLTASNTWAFIPNSALPGNETGTTTGPFNLSSLNTTTYGTIRPYATLSCDGSNNCPTLLDWTVRWAEGIAISGTLRAYDQSTNVTSGTVAVAVNGTLQVGKTGSVSGGSWTIDNVNVVPGDVITVFVSGAASSAEAVGVTRYDGSGDVTGIELFEHHLSLGSNDATSTAITNTHISLYDYTNTEDIFANVGGGVLSVCAESGCDDVKLYIKSGTTFQPGERVLTHDFDNHGTFVAGSLTHEVSGSWRNVGTTTMTGSTIVFAATSTTESINSTGAIVATFNNVTLGTTTGGATWTLGSVLDVSGNLTVSRGTLARSTTSISVGGTLSNEANGFWTGIGTTTFSGSTAANWRDLNSTLQNVGNVVIDGTSKTITLTGNVSLTNLVIGSDDALDVTTSNYTMTVAGNWLNQNAFVPRQGTVTFVSTSTSRTITVGSGSFYNLTFNGAGGTWSFPQNTVTISNNFTVATGTVTLPTATTTVAGSWNTASGTFAHNNGIVRFTATTPKTITMGGGLFTNTFYDARFDGSGSWSFVDSATTSRNLYITAGTVTFPSTRLAIGDSLSVTGGTFSGNGGTVDFYGSGTHTIATNNASFANLSFSGSGAWSFIPTTVTATGDLTVLAGTLTLPTATTTIGGSYSNTATVIPNGGTVLFNSTATGRTVAPGNSSFYNVQFNSVSGGWTLTQSATATNAVVLTAANTWTLSSGFTLSAGTSFANTMNGASTTWTGSTLSLESGSYAINTKTATGDTYGTLRLQAGTHAQVWNSSATVYSINASSSLYSQDHAAVDGDLYVFGAYSRTTGAEYWRYNTDFDGTTLTGSSTRQVDVRFASGASATFSNATLDVLGTALASTTIDNQGSGTYTIGVTRGTTSLQYYEFSNLGSSGVSLLDAAVVTTLDDGYFRLGVSGASALTIASSTIDANPAKQLFRVGFATTTAIAAYNVSQTIGTPSSYWWFRNGSGNLNGEAHDNDTGDPGTIRFDDSALTVTVAGTVFSDAGGTALVGGSCDGVTNVVRVVVDGATTYDGTCSNVDGSYSIPGIVVIGDPTLTVFLNNASGGERGAVVTRTPTGNITDLDIYANRVIVRNEDTDPLTFAHLARYDMDNDSDLRFTAATGTAPSLITQSGTELYVWNGATFVPDGNVTLLANASANGYDGTLVIADGATFTGVATSTYTVGGRFVVGAGATFSAASTTVYMNATSSGKSISGSSTVSFNELTFNGTGGTWNLGVDIVVAGDLEVNSGIVTGTNNLTISGNATGNGTLSLGTATTTLTHGGTFGGSSAWTFYNLVLGNGTVAATTTPVFATTTTINGQLTISNAHHLNAGGTVWDLAGAGTVFTGSGTFLSGTSTIRYSGAGATVASRTYYNLDVNAAVGSSTYTATGVGVLVVNDLTVGGSATTTLTFDTNDVVLGVTDDILIRANGTFVGSNSAALTIGGDWTNLGTYTHSGGTVTFNGSGSTAIAAGASSFSSVTINGTGTFTLTNHATATAAFTLVAHTDFTVATSQVLAVGGTFINTLGGGATTWTGSTLRLYGGGNYTVNASTTSDIYGTLSIVGTTQVRLWNSSAASYAIDTTASLYSQDHGGVDGALYIYGSYTRSSGNDYWSYATDFDGTALSGGSLRPVTVNFASGASAVVSGGSLAVVGAAGATTTVQNQGSGTYGLHIMGTASSTWLHYALRDGNSSGLVMSGTPTIGSLSYGDIEVSQNGGSGITVGGTVITANPAKTFTNNRFALDGVGAGVNVTATGSSVSSWRFTNHSGDIAGESYDSDPDGDPGYLVWDDSAALITISGRVYSDEGSTVSSVCDSSTPVVTVQVAGLTSYTSSCNAGTGVYSVSNVAYSPGDSFVAYIDGQSPKAATVSIAPVSSIANFDLYENRVIVRHEGVDPLTIDSMAIWDSSDDADIPFTAVSGSPDTLTLPANRKLLVWDAKTFTPGGTVTVTGGGAGQPYDGTLELQNNATVNAGAFTHTVGGSFITGTGATWNANTSEVVFTTTGASRTIDTNAAAFYKATFNGSGSWTVTDSTFTVTDDVTITAGTLTLPSATSTFGASFANNGGSAVVSAPVVFTSTAGGETVRFGGSIFADLRFTGSGSWTITDTNATTTGSVIKSAGGLTLPSGQWLVGGSFQNQGGTITHNTNELRLTSTSSATLRASSSDLYAVSFVGGGAYTLADHDLTLQDTLSITSGSVTFASGTLSVGGSFTATGGTFAHASGTVLFNGTGGGKTIDPGSSSFYNVQIGAPTGSYTLAANATATNNFTLSAADDFTAQSGVRLVVGGVFTNSVGGADTTWTGSTLVLNGNNAYTINTKAAGADTYAVIEIGSGSALRAWNSSATTITPAVGSSLYSQNHAAVPGVVNIYGDFRIATTTEYWSYATDFDGTSLSGSERAVSVRHASGATTTMESGTLHIVGVSGNETTITNQGSGTYAFTVTGGTLNATYYELRNANASGLSLQGTPTISSLSYGDFELAVGGGTLISLSSTTLNANASLVVTGNRFATTTAITGTNVAVTGSTPATWSFVGHTGNLDGENYDSDGVTACGSVRWEDSACLLIQQNHYRWRLDDGGEGVPDNEWYDQDWANRQRVRIDNADAQAYSNAAVKLTVAFETGMQADFDDLRFTDEGGTTTIPHFIETYTASTEAVVWVQLPTLPAEDTATTFMYFNNPAANDMSSSTQVFSFADNFEAGIGAYSGNTSLFTVDTAFNYERTAGLSNDGDENQLTTNGLYQTGSLISQGSTIRYFQYVSTASGAGSNDEVCTLFAMQVPTATNQNYAVCFEQFSTDRISLVRDVENREASGVVLASSTFSFTTGWYEVEVDWRTDNTMTVRVYDDGVLMLTLNATDSTYTTGGMGFAYWFNYGGWDLYTARPYLTTTPTVYFGAVQVPGGASWAAAQDTVASSFNTGDIARIRFVVENSGLAVTDKEFELEYAPRGAAPSCEAVDTGEYLTVPPQSSCGSSPLCMATSSNVTNNEAATDLLFDAAGQFISGEVIEDPSNITSPIDVDQNEYTELEYAITPTNNIVDQNLCLRVTDDGTELDTYLRVATLQLRFDPSFGAVTLNEGADIQLVAGTTTTVYATGTVTDLNGYLDLTNANMATATIYRSGAGPACSVDNNNCYRVTTSGGNCSFINCAGNSCTLSCSAEVYFHADPTDASTYEGEEWLAYLEAEDAASGYDFASAPGVELLTLQALTVDSTIDYGTLEANNNTGSYNASTSIGNIGNIPINLAVEGTDLSDGYSSVIPAEQQKFSTSTFAYTSCVSCVSVATSSPSTLEVGLAKSTSSSTIEEADIYWGIAVPYGVNAAPHTGINTLYAIGILD